MTVPIIVILLVFPNRYCNFIAAIIFSSAAITDYLDGFYARRRGLVSTFGKFMDPIADKLLICSAFIMMIPHGWVPGWVVCVIVAREIAVTGLRGVVSDKGGDVSASNLGKYKTGFQIAAAIPLIFHYPYFGLQPALPHQFVNVSLIYARDFRLAGHPLRRGRQYWSIC